MGKSQTREKAGPFVWRQWLLPWLVIVLLAALTARLVQSSGALFLLDAKFYDIGMVSRPPRAEERVTIMGFSEKFMQNRHVSQTPRDRLARLIDVLVTARPGVIAIDVWLDSRVEDGARRGDEKLRMALLNAKHAGVPVFLAQKAVESGEDVLGETGGKGTTAHGATLPYFVEAAAGVGGVDYQPDPDRVVRWLPVETKELQSLSLRAVTAPSPRSHPLPAPYFILDQARIDPRRQPAPIDYCAPPFPAGGAIPIHDAATLLEQPFLAPMLAEGKIVFIGATYPRSDDLFQTPYNTAGKYRRFYGVEILAHSAATFLQSMPRRSHEAPRVQFKILLLALLIGAMVSLSALRGLLPGVLSLLLSSGGALYLALISTRYAGHWPHYYPPSPLLASALLAWALGAGFRQWRVGQELKLVQEAFGGYVGDEVLQEMGGQLPEMGGEVRSVAVLFCDIRGFSSLAEKLHDDPARLLGLLNAHFEPLVEALKARGAYVDNYVGDLVMAIFGAPVSAGSLEEDTRQAVRAAREIARLVGERNEERHALGETEIDVGIGVHCGPAVVGNLGTRRKMHYTAIGDTVNIASRIESETRHYPAHLLVTHDVVRICGDEFLWEFVAETAVKGRATPVRLYKPGGDL